MRSLYLLAGVVSLSLTMPALAKPGNGQAKREQVGGRQKGNGTSAYQRRREDSRSRVQRTRVTSTDRNGNGVRDRDEGYGRMAKACPSGLAKKNNGCLPPGQAKKQFAVGERLPSSYNYYNVPEQYSDQYRDTNEDLFRYNEGNLYRVDAKTRLVEEVIRLLGR